MGVSTTSSYSGVTAGQTTGVAAAIDAAIAGVEALASAQDPWTPTLGGGWAIGNGTIDASYTQVGKFVFFNVAITWGSTSTFGGSSLTVSLPVTPAASHMATCRAGDASAAGSYAGGAIVSTGATATPLFTPAAAGGLSRPATSSVPMTWASSDTITITGCYEAA